MTLDDIDAKNMLRGKQLGFSDLQISSLLLGNYGENDIRTKRLGYASGAISPFVKQIDTLAAEYPAQTNYLYMTYHGDEHDVNEPTGSSIVLGSGAYRIGSSVEFDWCGVSTIRTLRKMGYKSTMINYNPETVSTDYDECDQLYFEELSCERVMDIYEKDKSQGVVVSVGGQIPNNLALPLHQAGVKIMGTCPTMIDSAEDRSKFSDIVDSLGIQQAPWKELKGTAEALRFADMVGYPVLVRPSYVLSGAAMNVAYDGDSLAAYLSQATEVADDKPVVISKFIEGGREIEMDGIAKNGLVLGCAIHEHVENAGVHSGDATLMLPTQNVSEYTKYRIEEATIKLVEALDITGPFNMQYIVKGSDVMVIETNLRASRSFPFVSKTMGVDFIEAATKIMMDEDISDMNLPTIGTRNRPSNFVGVKAPMFSFTRLGGADPILGVEMASTGEVACFGSDVHEAFLKALVSTGFKIPEKRIALTVQKAMLEEIVHHVHTLTQLGFEVYATAETYLFLKDKGVPSTLIYYADDKREPNIRTLIREGDIDMVVNLRDQGGNTEPKNNYVTRRTAVDFGIPLIVNPQLFAMFSEALDKESRRKTKISSANSIFDYYNAESEVETWTDPKEFH